MKGIRTPRKVIVSNCETPDHSTERSDLPNSERSVWVVNDDGHPKSPLSIERLPHNVKRNISCVARVKPTCKAMARKRRDPPDNSFPFFIDKSPSEVLVGDVGSRRQSTMNESVILLDSPGVSTASSEFPTERPAKEVRRQDSVDTVDLCSDDDGGGAERVIITNGSKRKRRKKMVLGVKKKRKLCTKVQDEPQPDIIVLDDEDDCTDKSSNNNGSIVMESAQVKVYAKSRVTRSVSDFSETPSNVAIPDSGPSGRQGNNLRYKHSEKPLTITRHQSKNTVLSGCTNPGPASNLSAEGNPTKPDILDTVGSNVFNPCGNVQQTGLRPIIIDGCNVAIAHGGNRMFSVKGLCICVEYFLRRGHHQVVALVPLHQRSKVSPQDRDILEALKYDSHLVFTPSRFIDNRLISSYDDRYIVQYAAAVGGVIVSRDNYRDLLTENPAWRDTINNRLLMPTWVGDILMFPVDPLGKRGPSLDDFLRFPST